MYIFYKNRIKCDQVDFYKKPNESASYWNYYIKKQILKSEEYAKRDEFIDNLTFSYTNENDLDSIHRILTIKDIQKIKDVYALSDDDKWKLISRISGTIENKLKTNEGYIEIDDNIYFKYFNNETIKNWRSKSHCARHDSKESIEEWEKLSEIDKISMIYAGLAICIKLLEIYP